MDYITFDVIGSNLTGSVDIKFGSGLHSSIPAKSPLSRNLMINLIGDETLMEPNSSYDSDI
jgi:hypothetical protein